MFERKRTKKEGPVGMRVGLGILAFLVAVSLQGQTNCTPPPPGLISWWRADGNALDWTGGNNGVLKGDVAYGPGEVGQAFVFGGDQSGVEVGNATNLDLQNFTIECWIKRGTNNLATLDGSPAGCIFGTSGWLLAIYNDGTLALFDANQFEDVEPPIEVTDTAWHHVAVTKSGTNVLFYIDGVGCPTNSLNDTFEFSSGATIGCVNDSLANAFYGSIDELSIYDQALPASEIQAIYNAGSAGKCITNSQANCTPPPPGLVSWWRAEDNTLDWTGGNNGTIDGGVTYGPGEVGETFVLNGNNCGVEVGSPTNLQLQNFTLEGMDSKSDEYGCHVGWFRRWVLL